MSRIAESIPVAVNRFGEPVRFSWRGESYRVQSRPERWFARREWWVEAARAARGIGAGVLEVEMWCLLACREVDALGSPAAGAQFELLRRAEDDSWQLLRVFD